MLQCMEPAKIVTLHFIWFITAWWELAKNANSSSHKELQKISNLNLSVQFPTSFDENNNSTWTFRDNRCCEGESEKLLQRFREHALYKRNHIRQLLRWLQLQWTWVHYNALIYIDKKNCVAKKRTKRHLDKFICKTCAISMVC